MSKEKTAKSVWAGRIGKKTVEALNRHRFEAYYCENREAALEKALELIPEGSSVCWGGSATMEETGIIEKLKSGNYKLLDRSKAKSREEALNISRQAFTADYFIMSSNAISADGQLVNIDGTGNRAAALIFGPKNVIVIAGINKIAADLDAAIARARNIAAPMNIQRFGLEKAPCITTGICHDCYAEDCICANIVITRISKPAGKIKVIIAGENLGF